MVLAIHPQLRNIFTASVTDTLQTTFLSKRLHESRTGGKRCPDGGIKREMCSANYLVQYLEMYPYSWSGSSLTRSPLVPLCHAIVVHVRVRAPHSDSKMDVSSALPLIGVRSNQNERAFTHCTPRRTAAMNERGNAAAQRTQYK